MFIRSISLLFLASCSVIATENPVTEQLSSTPESAPPPTSYPSLPAVDALVQSTMQNDHIPGLQAAIVKDGSVVWAGAYGIADTDLGTPVTLDTHFMVASVSKTVTGVALMAAQEAGHLSIDDDVMDHFGFRIRNPFNPGVAITGRHLLTHTSSIWDSWRMDQYYSLGDSSLPLNDMVYDYLNPNGANYGAANWGGYRPGRRYDYSNIGAATAGALVEASSGIPFDDWCDNEIFAPLGMDRTAWHLGDLNEPDVAHPHVWNGADYNVIPHYGFADYPDGQLRTTSEDLGRFLAMFMEGGAYDGTRILQTTTVDEMRTLHPSADQGLIWYGETYGGQEYIGHNGGETGVSADMFYRTSDNIGFVMIANGEPTGWGGWTDIIRQLLDEGTAL